MILSLTWILNVTSSALVHGESCTTNVDCVTTACASGSHVVCQHPNPSGGITADGGLCTCALNDYSK